MVPKADLSRGGQSPLRLQSRIGILTGPTATGKSSLALELAESAGGIEIVSADSLLVYRGLDIGTAKPSPEERARVRHHLIDIREPNEPFTAGDFKKEAEKAIAEITSRGKRALIVGGTGFYLKALLYGLWDAPKPDRELRARLEKEEDAVLLARLQRIDPEAALRIGKNDRYRLIRALEIFELSGKTPTQLEQERPVEPDPRFELWILDRPDDELFPRIEARVGTMIDRGLIDEVRALKERFPEPPRPLLSVGYRETLGYLEGRAPDGRKIEPGISGLISEITLSTRQLVKSQRTWFRGQAPAGAFVTPSALPALFREPYS